MLVSDSEVMHEVFGDHVAYIDSKDPGSLPGEDSGGAPESVESILDRYSWAQSARKLYDGLKRQGLL